MTATSRYIWGVLIIKSLRIRTRYHSLYDFRAENVLALEFIQESTVDSNIDMATQVERSLSLDHETVGAGDVVQALDTDLGWWYPAKVQQIDPDGSLTLEWINFSRFKQFKLERGE